MTSLREQIEVLGYIWTRDERNTQVKRQMHLHEYRSRVLDIIDQHRCIPDRDALARALANAAHDEGHHFWCRFNADCGLYGDSQPFADDIIAALEKP